MDFTCVAMELLRLLRGKRSQTAFSRRLGYRSNIAYRWESGRCFPTAAETLAMFERSGRSIEGAVRRFSISEEPSFGSFNPANSTSTAALLRHLRGKTALVEL